MGIGHLAAARPQPYVNAHNPNFHNGLVAVTGTLRVNLGLPHNDFQVFPTIRGVAADRLAALHVDWSLPGGSIKGQFDLTVYRRAIAAWSGATAVSSHTTGALAAAGMITAVELVAGSVTGAGNLRDSAAATTRDVRIVYDAAGIPTLSFLAADAVTSCKYQQIANVVDAVARNISFLVICNK